MTNTLRYIAVTNSDDPRTDIAAAIVLIERLNGAVPTDSDIRRGLIEDSLNPTDENVAAVRTGLLHE